MKTRRPASPAHGLARVLSKRGLCSRTQAAEWIRAGRVSVDDRVVRDPGFPVRVGCQSVRVDGHVPVAAGFHYIVLNKPRGLVTTARDDQGRDTVYRCFDGAGLPWVAPVGRLDKASEGLLLFSNDSGWAARITAPLTGPSKTYHVQIDRLVGADLLAALQAGVEHEGELLHMRSVRLLRAGGRHSWLEVELDEGRNRQIRRMLAAHDIGVLRLVRIGIGTLPLGELAKGQWRALLPDEAAALAPLSP